MSFVYGRNKKGVKPSVTRLTLGYRQVTLHVTSTE